MKFTKMQGAGNDFVVVETNDTQYDWSRVALAICDRHLGVGADGLLLLLPSKVADFRMRLFDADGSEAEACGNGLRCLVKYFADRGLAKSGTQKISVETMVGVRIAKIYRVDSRVAKVQSGMGEPKFGNKDIPVVIGQGKVVKIKSMTSYSVSVDGKELSLNLVSMGNPHAVYFCQDSVYDFPLSQIWPKMENLAIFPNRINFEIARVLNRREVEVRVWERGVGETLACGSGACAVAVAAQLYGYIENKVDIRLPGGTLQVEWKGTGEVLMRGPAETVFTGEWLNESGVSEPGSFNKRFPNEVNLK